MTNKIYSCRAGSVSAVLVVLHLLAIAGFAQSAGVASRSASHDFNGDGLGDLLWRNQHTGDVIVSIAGSIGNLSRSVVVQSVPRNWQIFGTGDLDGDGKADIVWRDQDTGDVAAWFMDGDRFRNWASFARVPDPNWQVVGTGDFDGDGKADLLWRNIRSGEIAMWFMNGETVRTAISVDATIAPNWQIEAIGDFDGDGRADLTWRSTGDGTVVGWLMNGSQIRSWAVLFAALPMGWHLEGVGDFDADGKADLLWVNTKGVNSVWLMNGLSVRSWSTFVDWSSAGWQIIGTGDKDGDGKADLIARSPLSGEIATVLMDGGTVKGDILNSFDGAVIPTPMTLTSTSLELSQFRVLEFSTARGRFEYVPVGQLRNTSGTTGLTLMSATYHLNGIGAAGNVPTTPFFSGIPFQAALQPGETIEYNPNFYGADDWYLTIDSELLAPSLTMVISYSDAAGHPFTLSVTADITPIGYAVVDAFWQAQ